jgi:hypothetical protein
MTFMGPFKVTVDQAQGQVKFERRQWTCWSDTRLVDVGQYVKPIG